jgi:hypothetical protein
MWFSCWTGTTDYSANPALCDEPDTAYPSFIQQTGEIGMPASIEASIVKAIVAEAKTVNFTSSGSILLVRASTAHERKPSRGQTTKPKQLHRSLPESSAFGNVSTIRVEYLARYAPGSLA